MQDKLSFASLLVYSGVLGVFGGGVTILFLVLFQAVQKLLWTTLPQQLGINTSHDIFPVAVCGIGGLILGLAIFFLGSYPGTIEEAVASYQKTKQFDYQHIWQALIISVISLGFGAALGPEAALTTIVGGSVTLIGIKLHRAEVIKYGAEIEKKLSRIKRLLLGLVAVSAGYIVTKPFGGNGYFNLDLANYSFHILDLGWVFIVIIAGALVGLIYDLIDNQLEQSLSSLRKKKIVLLTTLGGLSLGLLAVIQPLVLFSGHEGIRTMSSTFSTHSSGYFLAAALLKVAAACLCLATGWKGGRFFPLMFAGAAIGLCLAQIMPIPQTLALATGMSATLAYVLKKPILAAVLLFLFFPVSVFIPIILAAFLASKLATLIHDYQHKPALAN